MPLMKFFSIGNVFFTAYGYSMSYLEFTGTILNIICVWLVTRKNIWNWPIGNVAVVLFGILFYQIQLYSDLLEQVYFLITGFYGWWIWIRMGKAGERNEKTTDVSYNTVHSNSITILIVVVGTLGLGFGMSKIHLLLPRLFPTPASFPYLDAFTTVMSFAAQLLMAYKKIESWYLWIAVDVIGIGLYYQKDVKFVALLYLIFLVLATKGLLNWRSDFRKLNPIPTVQES